MIFIDNRLNNVMFSSINPIFARASSSLKITSSTQCNGFSIFGKRESTKNQFTVKKNLTKSLNLFHQKALVPISKYVSRGKPKSGAEKIVVGYKMETSFRRNQEAINNLLNKKGRFILATNEMNSKDYKDKQILEEYKEQQNIERGFHFLKDPWFMVDSVFLKLPRRIEALMMIMTLCLMIYNVGQYRFREQLKAQKRTLPNQLGQGSIKSHIKMDFPSHGRNRCGVFLR